MYLLRLRHLASRETYTAVVVVAAQGPSRALLGRLGPCMSMGGRGKEEGKVLPSMGQRSVGSSITACTVDLCSEPGSESRQIAQGTVHTL